MTALSLEDLATTSDDAAVRRRFDARNLAWFRILLVVFFLASLGMTIGRLVRPSIFAAFGATSLLIAVMTFFSLRKEWVRRHASATIITVLLAHYVLLISGSGKDWPAWTFLFPVVTLAFRMLVSELVLLHGTYFVVAAAVGIFAGGKDIPQQIVGIGVVNVIALTIELVASRGMRREVVGDWSERRHHAQEQLRMRDELRYARAIQLSMLPEAAPRLEWVDVAGASVPATEVGGDYFDYFVIGDRLAIVSGDVAGHGLASGLVLAGLRSGFTLLRDALGDPAAVLRRLHDLVSETSRRRTIVTCAVLLLDRENKRATFASAGHPPVIARRDGTVASVELFAAPLGVKLPLSIPQREMPFASGDVFVLHTDGVYETVNPHGESYGIERIEEVVRSCDPSASAAEVRDALVQDVERFRGGGAQLDDLTVVVARIV